MNVLERRLVQIARRFNMTGPEILAWYTAGIVTALLIVALFEAIRGGS